MAYWLEDTIGRAYFAPNVEKAGSHAEALARFIRPDFSYGSTVILEDPRVQEKSGEPTGGAVRILEYKAQEIVCQVRAGTDGYLVLLDSYYPGWKATVDGRATEIFRANYTFRAVPITSGDPRVVFSFHPRMFYWGLAISAMTLVAGLLLAVFTGRNRSV
jgi:hypothetical protein